MKNIKLMRLSITNFKGCQRRELNFGGKSASIYGRNETGKTTICDALNWLLFGKDSMGQTSFEIKPLDAEGNVRDRGAVTEVEAVLDVDGETVTLRRAYSEKWSTRRGSAQAVYDGNVSEFHVDGVPVKKNEYERKVAELASDELFRVLTGISWFCAGLSWQKRRELLFDVCGSASDREIMEQDERFAPLLAGMGRLSMDEFKKKLQADRKGLNGARNTVPARLDECRKTVEDLAGVDFAALREKRDGVTGQVERLQGELVKLSHGALLESKRNELEGLKNKLAALINDNERHRQSQIVPVVDMTQEMQRKIDQSKADFLHWTELVEGEKALARGLEEKVDRLRVRWMEEDSRTFQGGVCPTCGQQLPEEALRAAEERFTAEVVEEKRRLVEEADKTKTLLEAAQKRVVRNIENAVAAENEVARLKAELETYVPEEAPEVDDLPEFRDLAGALSRQIEALEQEVAGLEGESGAIREEVNGKISALRRELAAIDMELGKESMLHYARERQEQLRREAQETAEQLEAVDKLLSLCDDFSRHKARYLEESVNRHFRLVRFRLFQEQVNGGLADCCDATVNGVPYGTMNNGARINAGLDVISALSNHYGVTVPLFVDNAESVTGLLPMETQVIRLVVSEADEELRMEVES